MKKICNPFYSLAFLLLLAVSTSSCNSGKQLTAAATPEQVAGAIDSSKWIFWANDVMPQFGTNRNVSGDGYTVSFSGDKLLVYLPYYGKAYSGGAAYTGKSPLDFTSANFTIDKQQAKEKQWEITIKPKDNSEVQAMNFTIFSSGSANLNIIMTNRSGINYNGTIRVKK
ncbi:DUF4251 domain-containing protein [Ferruginibacter sp.]